MAMTVLGRKSSGELHLVVDKEGETIWFRYLKAKAFNIGASFIILKTILHSYMRLLTL